VALPIEYTGPRAPDWIDDTTLVQSGRHTGVYGEATDVMESAVSARSRHARRLFAGIALSYERVATVLSLGQDPRWRHALVAAVGAQNNDRVLDVATGTGMVARALVGRYGCRVIGLDQSAQMLVAGAADGRPLVRAQGEWLPFADASFDYVTFTYLLRYVDDPAATMCELARVLRPGGRIATLEFGVPANPMWRCLWRLYTRIGLPLAGRLLSTSWGTVGDFLGPSIERFYAVHSQAKLECYWRAAGLEGITVRRMSLGGGTVMSATKRTAPSPPGTSRMCCWELHWRLRLIHGSCSARSWLSVWLSASARNGRGQQDPARRTCLRIPYYARYGRAADTRTKTPTAARSAALARLKTVGPSSVPRRAPATAARTVTSHRAAMAPRATESGWPVIATRAADASWVRSPHSATKTTRKLAIHGAMRVRTFRGCRSACLRRNANTANTRKLKPAATRTG